MENPSSKIDDNILLTMFDSSSDSNITNQDSLDERKFIFLA
jgi:hypothetical protein